MIKAVLFDFGGVIYQHPKEIIPNVLSRIYNQPVKSVIQEYGKYKNQYFTGKISTEKLISLLSLTFTSKKTVEEVKELWLKYYSQLAIPNNKVLEIIKKLRKRYQVYLFSNTTEMSNLHNSQTGLYNYFNGLFLSYRMKVKKPDIKIYQKVISEIGIKPSECIFIDDDFQNLKPAKTMGIKTILFNVLTDSPSILEKELQRLQAD